jgi:hypothetical protein
MLRRIVARDLSSVYKQTWSLQRSTLVANRAYARPSPKIVSPLSMQRKFFLTNRPAERSVSASAQEDQKGSEHSVSELGSDMVSLCAISHDIALYHVIL